MRGNTQPSKKETPGAFGKGKPNEDGHKYLNKDYQEILAALNGICAPRKEDKLPADITEPMSRNCALFKPWKQAMVDDLNAINVAHGLPETQSGAPSKEDANKLDTAQTKSYLEAIRKLMNEPAMKLRKDFFTIKSAGFLQDRMDEKTINIDGAYLEPLYDIIII